MKFTSLILDLLESFYIQKFKPVANRDKNGRLKPATLEAAIMNFLKDCLEESRIEIRKFLYKSGEAEDK